MENKNQEFEEVGTFRSFWLEILIIGFILGIILLVLLKLGIIK